MAKRATISAQNQITVSSELVVIQCPDGSFTLNGNRVLTTNDIPDVEVVTAAASLTLTGPFSISPGTLDVQIQRVGKVVTVWLPSLYVSSGGSAGPIVAVGLPVIAQSPGISHILYIASPAGGTYQTAKLEVNGDTLYFYADVLGSDYGNGAGFNGWVQPFTIVYTIEE